MSDDRETRKPNEPAKGSDQVTDLNAKPLDDQDAQQVKGGRMLRDESPKE